MTTEEKLEKAIEFIKSIERLDLPTMTNFDIIDDASIYCSECGDCCEFDSNGIKVEYIEAREIDKIKDKAWHVLAELT